MSSIFEARRVAITGGAGFLGRKLLARLEALGHRRPFVPLKSDYDLRDRGAIDLFINDARPEVVIHLAASVGGIGTNRENPGSFFYDNLIMGAQLIEAARRFNVHKFVCIGTICAYPKHSPIPFREETLWDGYPEETNAAYGLAKKALLVQLQAYRQQYGMNGIYLLPVNLYGPGDDFDPASSHVIPALIRKCVEARESGASSVTCWGTGEATREFLFVEDCADAIIAATERYDDGEPVNIGTGSEISIRDLAEKIRQLTRFEGRLEWDATHPDGQPRRSLDTQRAERDFGFRAATTFDEGLRRTVQWFEENRP